MLHSLPRRAARWAAAPSRGIPQFYVRDARGWFTRDGARLLRIPKTGGATEILAVAAGPIGTLAVDDKAVYFNVGGALLRLDLE